MRVLTQGEVERLIDLDELIDVVGVALADLSAGRASVPPRIGAFVEDRLALLGAMASYVPSLGVLAAKLVSVFPGNNGSELPTHQAIIVAFDPASGEPLAAMDGTYITAVRTAAASALSARILAKPDAHILALLGTGVQAGWHACYLPRVRAISQIRVASHDPARAKAFARQLEAQLQVAVAPCESFEEACQGADLICAATHPTEPVVRSSWVTPGCHVMSVGVSNSGHEVDQELIRNATVFVESRTFAEARMPAGSNELFQAAATGIKALEELTELGALVGSGRTRRSDDEVTLYKSIGVAVEDAAAVSLVLRGLAPRAP